MRQSDSPRAQFALIVDHLDWCPAVPTKTTCNDPLLAVVLGLFSRKVVGWAMGPNMETPLVLKALGMALVARRPAAGLIHHSDRGSQYATAEHVRGVGGTRHSAVHGLQGKLLGQRRHGDLRCQLEGRQLGEHGPADPRGRPPALFDWLMI